MATPVWNEKRKQWELDEVRDGERRQFCCKTPGARGLAIIRKRRTAWIDGYTLKSTWRIEKCLDAFLEDLKDKSGEKSENYIQREQHVRLYIKPRLKSKRIGKITEQDWQECISKAKGQEGQQLARKTLQNLRGTITSFCRYAKKAQMIEHMPDDLYIPDIAPESNKYILLPNELTELLTAPCAAWYWNAWRFMACTGMRPGEVYGLQHKAIKGNVLTVQQSVNRLQQITQGKEKRKRRKEGPKRIVLSPFALGILEDQKKQCKDAGIGRSAWVFPSQDGDLANPKTSYKQWSEYRAKHDITISPYEFRHTFNSMMKGRLPEAWRKMILGHTKNMDTDGVYGHEVPGELAQAAVIIEEVIQEIIVKNKTEKQGQKTGTQ